MEEVCGGGLWVRLRACPEHFPDLQPWFVPCLSRCWREENGIELSGFSDRSETDPVVLAWLGRVGTTSYTLNRLAAKMCLKEA